MMAAVGVYRVGQLGDTIAALPAMEAIRSGNPHADMVLISDQHAGSGFVSAWEVVRALELFSDSLVYDPSMSGRNRLIEYFHLAKQIRQHEIRTLFYLAPFFRTRNSIRRDRFFFKVVCGIQKCYGFESTDHLCRQRDDAGRLVAFPAETDRLLSIVGEAGLTIPEPSQARYPLPRRIQEQRRINELWQAANFSAYDRVVAIGPGSKMPAKRWPIERFASLVTRLLATFPDIQIVVLDGGEDHALGQAVVEATQKRVVNWAGQLSILDSLEVLRRCPLYIGNDTGTMHLAAAAGARCIALFSARDHPGIWEPYGSEHVVLRKDVPCAGCFLIRCEEQQMACLMQIYVDEVFRSCVAALQNTQKDTHHSRGQCREGNKAERVCAELQEA